MPLPSFTTSDDGRALAGVCAGIAQALGVEVTLVRLVFALLALAGGAGIVLYLALWAWSRTERAWWTMLLVLVAGALVLGAVGVSDRAVVGIVLVAAGASAPTRRSRTEGWRSPASALACCSKGDRHRRACWRRVPSQAGCC